MSSGAFALDKAIVKSYDIRGIYGEQFDPRFAYRLGRALARLVGARTAVVGHDVRIGSPELFAAVVAGLRDESAEVTALGLCPTECVYYACGRGEGADLGVMITASHNPPEYNGFKIVGPGVAPVTGDTGLREAVRLAAELDDPQDGVYPAVIETTDVVPAYVAEAIESIGLPDASGLQVVVDASNGAGELFWRKLASYWTGKVSLINAAPDGRFPGHSPDPTKPQNLQGLVTAVTESVAALGLCYDGDADRVVAVLPDGRVLGGSETAACLMERLLGAGVRGRFGLGQCVSRRTWDWAKSRGADCVMLPVGHSKIKRLMRADHDIVFAGESAGHYYYRDFHFSDSALWTTLHLLNMLPGGGLTSFMDSLPGRWVSAKSLAPLRGETLEAGRDLARKVMAEVIRLHGDYVEITCEVDDAVRRSCTPQYIASCDGARVDYADWWVSARPSGTEPIVRLTLEADGEERLQEILGELTGALAGSGD